MNNESRLRSPTVYRRLTAYSVETLAISHQFVEAQRSFSNWLQQTHQMPERLAYHFTCHLARRLGQGLLNEAERLKTNPDYFLSKVPDYLQQIEQQISEAESPDTLSRYQAYRDILHRLLNNDQEDSSLSLKPGR